LRLISIIRYGTERYPEKVARRLRLLNITTWIVSAVASGFVYCMSRRGVTGAQLGLAPDIQAYLQLVADAPATVEVLTIELRQSSKFMKEYDNPEFASFLRMLGGIIADGQACGELDAAIPGHIAARMIFGILDELALAWVLAQQPVKAQAISGTQSGTRPKKFDIVRAADWVVALVTNGLDKRANKELPP